MPKDAEGPWNPASATIGLPADMKKAVEDRRHGIRTGKVEPHMRRWTWRRIPDDPVRWPNKHGQVVFVKACMVGRVKTVVDITDPNNPNKENAA